MDLTDDDIREFQTIWLHEFNEHISADNARRRAQELIELYSLFADTAQRLARDDRPDPPTQ